MQRRAQQLDARRSKELRHIRPTDLPLHLGRHRQHRRDERRQIETRKDGQRVPEREERIARHRHRSRPRPRPCGASKHLGVLTVLEQAERHVHRAGGGEFGGARGRGGGGPVGDGGFAGVDRVGGEVGAEVEGRDQEGRFRGQEAVGGREEAGEGGEEGGAERAAGGGAFDYGSGECQQRF